MLHTRHPREIIVIPAKAATQAQMCGAARLGSRFGGCNPISTHVSSSPAVGYAAKKGTAHVVSGRVSDQRTSETQPKVPILARQTRKSRLDYSPFRGNDGMDGSPLPSLGITQCARAPRWMKMLVQRAWVAAIERDPNSSNEVALDRNNAHALFLPGQTLMWLGPPEAAIPDMGSANRLDPRDPNSAFADCAVAACNLLLGRSERRSGGGEASPGGGDQVEAGSFLAGTMARHTTLDHQSPALGCSRRRQ